MTVQDFLKLSMINNKRIEQRREEERNERRISDERKERRREEAERRREMAELRREEYKRRRDEERREDQRQFRLLIMCLGSALGGSMMNQNNVDMTMGNMNQRATNVENVYRPVPTWRTSIIYLQT